MKLEHSHVVSVEMIGESALTRRISEVEEEMAVHAEARARRVSLPGRTSRGPVENLREILCTSSSSETSEKTSKMLHLSANFSSASSLFPTHPSPLFLPPPLLHLRLGWFA